MHPRSSPSTCLLLRSIVSALTLIRAMFRLMSSHYELTSSVGTDGVPVLVSNLKRSPKRLRYAGTDPNRRLLPIEQLFVEVALLARIVTKASPTGARTAQSVSDMTRAELRAVFLPS